VTGGASIKTDLVQPPTRSRPEPGKRRAYLRHGDALRSAGHADETDLFLIDGADDALGIGQSLCSGDESVHLLGPDSMVS
jgi:hypothetical protein